MNSFPGAGVSLKDRPMSLRGSHNVMWVLIGRAK